MDNTLKRLMEYNEARITQLESRLKEIKDNPNALRACDYVEGLLDSCYAIRFFYKQESVDEVLE